MGTLKINGIDILTLSTPISNDEIGTKQNIIGSLIKGLKPELDNGTQKLLDAGYKVNDNYIIDNYYDASKSKIKNNGHDITLAYNGTRPRNINSFTLTMSENVTKYINNIDGVLYVADKPRESGTKVLENLMSTDIDHKTCIFNIAMWGAGGKGGGSGYWLIAGNKGGVGGAGGGKLFSHIELENGGCIKIHTSSDKGRTTQANPDIAGNIRAASIVMTSKISESDNDDSKVIAKCTGGLNGRTYKGGSGGSHGDSTDGGGEASCASSNWLLNDDFLYGKIQYLLKANGGNKNPNGGTGKSSTFEKIVNSEKQTWEYIYGNQENNKGILELTGKGGSGGGGQGYGDSGGGSYGNGGNAGVPGSGKTGDKGGGGGGAGASGNGTTGNGGDGGYAGFAIFY